MKRSSARPAQRESPPGRLPDAEQSLQQGQLSIRRLLAATTSMAAYFAWSRGADAVTNSLLLSTCLGFSIGVLLRGPEGGFAGAVIGMLLFPICLLTLFLAGLAFLG